MINKLQPFRVYRELEIGEQVCLFADPAESVDYCAAIGISMKYHDIPYVFNDRIESSQFGHELYNIAVYTEHATQIWPTIGVERNTGQATIYVLTVKNYPEMFRMRIFDHATQRESDKIGWLTTEPTRKKMLDDLSLVLRQDSLMVYDPDVISQLRSFVVSRKGRPEAESGTHDDLVMALAGAYQLFQLVPRRGLDDDVDESKMRKGDRWRFR